MERIGIIGAGRLGSVLARALVARGLTEDGLLLSRGGSPSSRKRLAALGLERFLASNDEIAGSCGIVIATLRPQAAGILGELAFGPSTLLVSCMAGIPIASLAARTSTRIVRAMTSSPDSLKDGAGIAAFSPDDKRVAELLGFMGFAALPFADEALMDAFTAAVCLPAAFLVAGESARKALPALARSYPALDSVFEWVPRVLPDFPSDEAREAYLRRMATPGGVTERMVAALRRGATLEEAFSEGLGRAREIAAAALAAS